MKRLPLITLIFLLGCSSSSNQKVIVSDSELEYAKSVFTEFNEALQLDNGRLWNYNLHGPTLLINKETGVVIANEPDDKGALAKLGDLWVGVLPESIVGANTAIDWNGKRWATYLLPLSENGAERIDGLIHESFHRIQPEIGFDNIAEIQSVHLDSKEGRIYLKLEYEALKKALQSEEPMAHIQNALHFRQYRHQLFPESRNAENTLEIMEGLAQYTGSILSPRTNEEYKQYYISLIEMSQRLPSYVRSFAYFTIPVYGYFMKQTDDLWNQKINKETNLTDFILESFQIEPKELNIERIKRIGEPYGMDSIVDSENLREQKHLAQIERYKTTFLIDSVLVIPLHEMRFNFDPRNIVPLENFGTVYPIITITDNWGILKVDSLGALMSSQWNKVTLSYPISITDTLVQGKGWQLTLNSSWVLKNEGVKYILVKK
jgi:hypothetical protein